MKTPVGEKKKKEGIYVKIERGKWGATLNCEIAKRYN